MWFRAQIPNSCDQQSQCYSRLRHNKTEIKWRIKNYHKGLQSMTNGRWSMEEGGASHDQCQCVCVCVFFSPKFDHVTWICSEVMRLLVKGHSHCHAPLSQLARTQTHTFTHKHSGENCGHLKWGFFVEQPTDRQSDLQSCWSQLKIVHCRIFGNYQHLQVHFHFLLH